LGRKTADKNRTRNTRQKSGCFVAILIRMNDDNETLSSRSQGKHGLRREGANYTADPVITRTNPAGNIEVRTILRRNGKRALPGGFRDPIGTDEKGQVVFEDPKDAALRELGEEAGLTGIEHLPATIVYEGIVPDERSEGAPGSPGARWIETAAVHIDVTGIPGMDTHWVGDEGASDARWDEVTDEFLDSMNANHGDIVRRAIAHMNQEKNEQA